MTGISIRRTGLDKKNVNVIASHSKPVSKENPSPEELAPVREGRSRRGLARLATLRVVSLLPPPPRFFSEEKKYHIFKRVRKFFFNS